MDDRTLVEKSGFLPSTGIRSVNPDVPTQYDEESSFINEAREELSRINLASYTPPVLAVDPNVDDDDDESGSLSGIDTSFPTLRSAFGDGDDPIKRKKEAQNKLNEMMKSIQDKARSTYSGKQASYGGIISENQQSANEEFGVFGMGRTIKIDEAYNFLSDGVTGLAKYEGYTAGIDNEDYYAKRQTTSEKFFKGLGKLGSKTILYGVSGVAGIIPAAYNLIKTGSLTAAFDNDFTRMISDLDERLNHALPHYYTKEERNMGLLERMGTANFYFNDIMGNGLPFIAGAILSAYLTGGLGVASLGAIGAKIGLRAAAKMAASKVAAGLVKSSFGAYRAGALYGRAIGNVAKIGVNTLVGAGWESSVEAQSFMKDSEMKYKQYFKSMYGRNPNQNEMTEFRSSISGTANNIFAANMAIVGLSNYLLIGKYLGVDTGIMGKFIPGFKHISKAGEGIGKFTDRYLFGLGTKKVAGDAGKRQAVKANLFQKSLATVWNVSKRPISEGVWEEGMQGVAQRMGEDFIRARYDKTYLNASSSILDSFSKAVTSQFTTKEGIIEVGIGAMLGGMFGVRNGFFGVFERRNEDIIINDNLKKFNENNAFTAQAVKDSMRNIAEFNGMLNSDDANEYSKFELADRMNVLDDMSNNFISMVKSLDNSELASEMKTDEENVARIKDMAIKDFKKKLDNYKKSTSFAEAVTAETSSDLYRANVANSVYRGLGAKDRAMELSEDIADYVHDNGLSDDLNSFYYLSSEVSEKAGRLRKLRSEIDDINNEIERIATTTRRVENGVDTEAERIKQKTAELDKLNKEYSDLSAKLLKASREGFHSSDLIANVEDLFDSNTVTVDGILKAYDSVSSLVDYIENNKGKKEAEDLRSMVIAYQQAITEYKVMRSFMDSIQDKRFMRHDFSLFSALLNDIVSSKTEPMESDRFYQSSNGNPVGLDEKIDELLEAGDIDADEAFTLKVFGHLNDGISQKEHEDIVTDWDYKSAMEDDYLSNSVSNQIADKIYTGNSDLLSPREREIYNKYKQDIDDEVAARGDSPASMIKSLNDKIEKYLEPESVYDENEVIVDIVRSNLESDKQVELDGAISSYTDLMNRKDKGENVDEDELVEKELIINDLGLSGGITNLVHHINQNRLIRNGNSTEQIVNDFGSRDADVDSLTNEFDASDNTPGSNIDSAQNPEILTVRKISKGGKSWYEVSGLRADKFVSMIKSSSPAKVSYETNPNGTKKYSININGEVITISEQPNHARWTIDIDSAGVLNTYTDVLIQDVGSSYSFVYKRLDSGKLVPYRTGVGFGVNEVDKIDQDALAETKKGDEVNLEVDVNDTYNQSLFNEYNDAVLSGDKKRIENAERKVMSNMVIKVMRGGKFISVVKADTGGVDGINDIRVTAFNKWKKNAGKASIVDIGTYTVAQMLPGRPVFNMETIIQGSAVKVNMPISEKGAERIVDVGYVVNGKVVLKNGTKYHGFPFASSVLKGKKTYSNSVIPVVVVKGKNGTNYLFPVGLRQVESAEGERWISFIDMLLDSSDVDLLSMARNDIQDLNVYLMKLGLDPSVYQVSYSNPIEDLKRAKEAIAERSSIPDVRKWVEDGGRSVKDIVMSDVESAVDFNGEPFAAPKIRIQFGGKASSKKKSKVSSIEDDVPFPEEGNQPAAVDNKEDATSENNNSSDNDSKTDAQQEKDKSSSSSDREFGKSFESRLEDIEDHAKKENLPTFVSIYDFIARKIVGGKIRFLRDRKNPKSLKNEMGLDPKGTVGDKISSSKKNGGMTMAEYVAWLRSQKDRVVIDYVSSRSDEQIISELKSFLKAVGFKPSSFLNYSLRVNGMDTLKEYNTKEDVDRMEDKVNSLLSEVAPDVNDETVKEVSSAIVSGDLSAMEQKSFTEEEKSGILEDVASALGDSPGNEEVVDNIKTELNKTQENGGEESTGSGEVRTKEDGDKKGDGKSEGQPGEDVRAEGDTGLSGSQEGRIDNYRENGDKFSDIAEAALWLLRRAAGITSIPEGEEVYVEGDEVNSIMTDMESRYGINTLEHSHTTGAIRSLDGVSGYKVEFGLTPMTWKPFIRISNPVKESEEPKEEFYISEESSTPISRVTAPRFLFGGDEAYQTIAAKTEPIPENVMARNGIKFGMSVTQLTKLGYKKAGGNWIYKFYTNTGSYDMYNIDTGEAFRVNFGSNGGKMNNSFIRSLSQSGRNIPNMRKAMSQEEISRSQSLANSSNNSDSKKEINTKC